ncbi:MAG: GDSL-type esterase/lipase family protein [Gemmatimonadaceae bacterium]
MSPIVKRIRPNSRPLTRGRYALFLTVTLLAPLILVGVVEVGLRIARPDGGLPAFIAAPVAGGQYRMTNPAVTGRWFSGIRMPPTPLVEPFAADKPDRAFRVFVMGESSAAGFPYPRNATFSRLLHDVLRDVLPGVQVEIVNLGIAATNTFAIADMAREVARQRPDVVLIYAGHNEYYGALGAASRESVFGSAKVTRWYLRALRARTMLALRDAVQSLRNTRQSGGDALETAGLMEMLARDREVPLGGRIYRAGVDQFESNLEAITEVFRRHGIPVSIGSLASNLKDQPPFVALSNDRNGAEAAFRDAGTMLARGDTAGARRLFIRARDLDVVRFRAPSSFNDVIRRAASRPGVRYVPVAEAFALASPGGIPGRELFLEHVHPNRTGYALIARVFFDDLLGSGLIGASAEIALARPWDDYVRGAPVTAFDERVALHTVRTLTALWPFVPVGRQTDYRGTYTPVDASDSLAFAVSRGASWEAAKLQLAAHYEQRGHFDSAAAEYAGLARDAPLFDEPWRLLGRSLAAAGRTIEAEEALREAVRIRPTASALAELGALAVRRRDSREAAELLQRALALDPNRPALLYQLSLAYGMAQDIPNARATALRLARVSPDYPGLADWLEALGLRP